MNVSLTAQSEEKKRRKKGLLALSHGGGGGGGAGSCFRHVYKFKNISDAFAMLLILVQRSGGMR